MAVGVLKVSITTVHKALALDNSFPTAVHSCCDTSYGETCNYSKLYGFRRDKEGTPDSQRERIGGSEAVVCSCEVYTLAN